MRFIIFVLIIIGIVKFIQAMRKPVEQREPAEPIDYRTWKFTPREKYYTDLQLEIGSERMAEDYEKFLDSPLGEDSDNLSTPEFERDYDNPFRYHVVPKNSYISSRAAQNAHDDNQKDFESMYLDRIYEFCGDVKDDDWNNPDPDDLRLQLKENLIRQWLQYYAKKSGIDTTAVHIGYDDAGEPQLMDAQNNPIYPEKLMRFLIDNE